MTPQKQLHLHRPAEGIYGDCYRTVLACLLDLSPEQVPHFHREMTGWENQTIYREWLAERGLCLIETSWPGTWDLQTDLLDRMHHICGSAHYMLSGVSPRGFPHIVICRGAEMVWDTHPDNTFIVGPCTDGNYWTSFIGALV